MNNKDNDALEVFLRTHWTELKREPTLTPPIELDDFIAFSESPGQLRIGAIEGHQIVGLVTLTPYSDCNLVHRRVLGLGILEPFRGLGLGRKLMRLALDCAQALPFLSWVDGTACQANQRVVLLDISEGFQIIGVTPDYYRVKGDPQTVLSLTIDLQERRRLQHV